MPRIFEQLSLLGSIDATDVIVAGWKCLLDSFESMIELTESAFLYSRIGFVMYIERLQDPEGAERAMKALIKQSEVAYGRGSWKALDCVRVLAWLFVYNGKCDEALDLAESIISRASCLRRHPQSTLLSAGHVILAEVHMRRGNPGAAELHIWKGLEADVNLQGWRGSKILYRLVNLETFLRQNGDQLWADSVKVQRTSLWGYQGLGRDRR